MNIDSKKQFVTQFFTYMGDGKQRPKALEMMTPDAIWWIPGIGNWSKEQLLAGMGAADKCFASGIEPEFLGITVEGDRVAVESVSRADIVDGNQYNNRYHCLVLFDGDLIREVREYCDTKYAADMLGHLLS